MKKTILIVDDDADDRLLFCEAVKELDSEIDCVECINGEEALDLLKQPGAPRPDYIFLDLNMPRMNGDKCLVEIKKNKRIKNIPIIIYTTSKFKSGWEEMVRLPDVHFVSKPCKQSELLDIISSVLEEKWERIHVD